MIRSNKKLAPFTDEALSAVVEVLKKVGLKEGEGFDYFAKNPDAYRFGDVLEWSERGFGTRFYLTLGRSGRVEEILCVNLDTRYEAVPQDKLDEINEALADILTTLNQ